LIVVFVAAYTFAGVHSFYGEKRSGALELILVTPVPVNSIIMGRLCALWKQFLPAALVLAAFDLSGDWINYSHSPVEDSIGMYLSDHGLLFYIAKRCAAACVFLILPVLATYFGLRVKNLIVAAVLTWVSLWLPWFLLGVVVAYSARDYGIGEYETRYMGVMPPAVFLSYLALAGAAFFLLRRRLSRRLYSF
jgi:ABC-type transport system involved in cytochrome c biogenesis permease component